MLSFSVCIQCMFERSVTQPWKHNVFLAFFPLNSASQWLERWYDRWELWVGYLGNHFYLDIRQWVCAIHDGIGSTYSSWYIYLGRTWMAALPSTTRKPNYGVRWLNERKIRPQFGNEMTNGFSCVMKCNAIRNAELGDCGRVDSIGKFRIMIWKG